MKYFKSMLLIYCFSFSISKSQTITDVIAKQEGNKVVISYNLQSNSDVEISLYISEIGDSLFTGPLKNVTGDVGLVFTSGTKTIIWNTLQDRDVVVGNYIFRVKGVGKYGMFIDSRDGASYKTTRIGKQVIMAENLAYKPSYGSFWVFNNSQNISPGYGYLYDWETAKNVCPNGWHLPSKEEFDTLILNTGGSGLNAYKNLRPTGNSGFSALFGGCRNVDGTFYSNEPTAYFWSNSLSYGGYSWCLYFFSTAKNAYMKGNNKESGLSIRCFKDN